MLVVSNLVDIFYHPEQTTEYGYVVDVAIFIAIWVFIFLISAHLRADDLTACVSGCYIIEHDDSHTALNSYGLLERGNFIGILAESNYGSE